MWPCRPGPPDTDAKIGSKDWYFLGMTFTDRQQALLDALEARLIVLDGAMGTLAVHEREYEA